MDAGQGTATFRSGLPYDTAFRDIPCPRRPAASCGYELSRMAGWEKSRLNYQFTRGSRGMYAVSSRTASRNTRPAR